MDNLPEIKQYCILYLYSCNRFNFIYFLLFFLIYGFYCQLFLNLHYIIMSIFCCYSMYCFLFGYSQNQPHDLIKYIHTCIYYVILIVAFTMTSTQVT